MITQLDITPDRACGTRVRVTQCTVKASSKPSKEHRSVPATVIAVTVAEEAVVVIVEVVEATAEMSSSSELGATVGAGVCVKCDDGEEAKGSETDTQTRNKDTRKEVPWRKRKWKWV